MRCATIFGDFVAAVRASYPGVPLFALGESMGGAVMLTAWPSRAPALKLDGVILAAPAVWSRADMPLSYRVALFLAAHLMPGLIVSGSGLKIVPSDNIPMLRALSRDPYVIKQTRTDAVYGLVDLMDEARQAPDHLTVTPPILFLYGKNDQIIPRAAHRSGDCRLGRARHGAVSTTRAITCCCATWKAKPGAPGCGGLDRATKVRLNRYLRGNTSGEKSWKTRNPTCATRRRIRSPSPIPTPGWPAKTTRAREPIMPQVRHACGDAGNRQGSGRRPSHQKQLTKI